MKPVGYEAGGTDEVPFTSALRNASYWCRGSAWVPPRWSRGLESNQLPPAYEAGKRPALFAGKLDPPAGFAPASPRYQRGASLSTLWRILKWSGTSEAEDGNGGGRQAGENVLPRVPRRSERRGLLSSSCPSCKRGATGNRTLICAMPLRRPTIERWPQKMVGPTGNAPVVSCPPDRRIRFLPPAR